MLTSGHISLFYIHCNKRGEPFKRVQSHQNEHEYVIETGMSMHAMHKYIVMPRLNVIAYILSEILQVKKLSSFRRNCDLKVKVEVIGLAMVKHRPLVGLSSYTNL